MLLVAGVKVTQPPFPQQCIPKPVFKGMTKCIQAVAHGLDHTYSNFGLGGMASVFQLMEIAHTHYWTKELNEGVSDLSASIMSSQSASPMGSRENLHSPTAEASEWSNSSVNSRKGSVQEPNRRLSEHDPHNPHQEQSTTEMFKDLLTQKRNMLMSKLTSFDSDTVHGSNVSVASESMNVPKTGQLIPSISCRSTVSDTEYENVSIQGVGFSHLRMNS